MTTEIHKGKIPWKGEAVSRVLTKIWNNMKKQKDDLDTPETGEELNLNGNGTRLNPYSDTALMLDCLLEELKKGEEAEIVKSYTTHSLRFCKIMEFILNNLEILKKLELVSDGQDFEVSPVLAKLLAELPYNQDTGEKEEYKQWTFDLVEICRRALQGE